MINKHQRKVKQTLTLKDIYSYLKLQNNIQKLEQLEILKEVVYNLYLVADTYCSSNPHQVTQAGFAGAVVGTKVNGGSWSQAFSSGVKGAIAGAVTAGVGEYAKGLEAFQKIMVQSGASGISSEIMGGSFKDGFKMGLVTASARYLYKNTMGYKAPIKGAHKLANEYGQYIEKNGVPNNLNINVFGTNTSQLTGNFFSDFFKQGGALSRVAQYIPGANAVSRLHDHYQIWFDKLAGGVQNSWTRTILNVPAMIPATVISYGALASDHTYLINQNRRKK